MRPARALWALAIAVLFTLQGCIFLGNYIGPLTQHSPPVVAAERGDIAAMRVALDGDARLVKVRGWRGTTLLHDAVRFEQEKMAAYLLSRGARVDARDRKGLTPLHTAATNGYVPIARLLLGHGADRDAIDRSGRTPLDRAVEWEQTDAADFLRSQGARTAADIRPPL